MIFKNQEGDLSQKLLEPKMWLLVNHTNRKNTLHWNWYLLKSGNCKSESEELQNDKTQCWLEPVVWLNDHKINEWWCNYIFHILPCWGINYLKSLVKLNVVYSDIYIILNFYLKWHIQNERKRWKQDLWQPKITAFHQKDFSNEPPIYFR